MQVAEPYNAALSITAKARKSIQLTGSEVCPVGQSVHELAPEAENVLAGQLVQVVASAPLYVPAAHVEHCPLSMN